MRVDISTVDIEAALERSGHATTPDNVTAVKDALRDSGPLLKMLIAGLELPNKFSSTPLF